MPPMVLLDATPLAGTGCDQADTTYVRGLIGEFRHDPEQGRPQLLLAAATPPPPGYVACRLPRRPGPGARAARRGRSDADVPEVAVADLVHLTSSDPMSAPRQVSSCHDLPALRFPAIEFGAGRGAARGRYNRFLDRLLWARLVMVPTRAAARDLTELLGIPEQRIRVIPFGAPALTEPAAPEERPPTVLVVANREPHTNARLAVQALACPNPRHDTRLGIVGVDDRRRRNRLARLAASLGIAERVQVAAIVDADRLAELRRDAAVARVPSRAEGVSVPALAAMAAGPPVLASDLPELAEQLGSAGLRVPGYDPGRRAETLDGVLEDATTRAGLVASSHARAQSLSWRETARQTRACYAEAIDG